MCDHAIPLEACRDCRHECNPPTIATMNPDRTLTYVRAVGERWRCPGCRRMWTVRADSGIRLGGHRLRGSAWVRRGWRVWLFG